MFVQPIKAIGTALRSLFQNRRVMVLLLALYAALLGSIYLFASTREATIFQLVLTFVLVLGAPALFFLLQAISVDYANGPASIRKTLSNCLKLIAVSVPVLALTLAALYGLNKIETAATTVTTIRYLLAGVFAPLLTIQLWLATSAGGFRYLFRSLKNVLLKTLSPQSMLVYALGFVIFAVVPYMLLAKTISAERAWLEFSLLVLRLAIAALLILLGWVTTVGALSILNRGSYATPSKE
jgi:hypothetical protein